MGTLNLGVLFILGVGVFGGILGASLFQRLRIPHVVGYVAIGLLIGQSGLGLVGSKDIEQFRSLNLFALGIIGLLVGGELQGSIFKKYGKQFAAILLGEGLAAFVLVGVCSGVIVWLVTHTFAVSLAAGIVFGAIASATDPASTIEVLWEYRSRGVMTTCLVAIVALDDTLAMTLYGLGTSISQMLTGGGHASLVHESLKIGVDLFGAILLGFVAALVLNFILRYLFQPEKALAIAIGTVLLVIGLAVAVDMDVILATMALGVTLVNLAPKRSRELFGIVRNFATPIYVIFFVLVGARLGIGNMPGWLWAVVVGYVVFRTVGKVAGAYVGARITGAAPSVRRYAGLGLFAQGGVAVGLSIMASQHLGHITIDKVTGLTLGDTIIFGVAATTLVVQIIGPPMVKLAIKLAGEIGRNVTEEDVVASLKVGDVMKGQVVLVHEPDPVNKVLELFSTYDNLVYPVVDRSERIVGVISLEGLKDVLANQDSWTWLVAADVMSAVEETFTTDTRLKHALDTMRELRLEQVPVLKSETEPAPVGILDMRKVRLVIDDEIMRRQQVGPTPVPASIAEG